MDKSSANQIYSKQRYNCMHCGKHRKGRKEILRKFKPGCVDFCQATAIAILW